MKTSQSNCGEKLVCFVCEQPIEDNDYIAFVESEMVVCARCTFDGMKKKDGTAKNR